MSPFSFCIWGLKLRAMKNLEKLRSRLGETDEEILRLIARRQELAREIGQAKQGTGHPTRDYAQEKEVVQRAIESAQPHNLSEDFVQSLMLLLIEASLTLQEQDKVIQRAGGSGRRVLVIGGSGKMGRWISRFLSSQGFEVEVADPSAESPEFTCFPDWRQCDLKHDIIAIAAPLGTTNEILLEMSKGPPSGLVFDIGSLKSPLRDGLKALASAGAKVASIHPMFGPDTELLSNRHIIFVDLGNQDAMEEARALFEPTMAVQVEMDLESHDRLIAYILGLSHALNIAFVTALTESGEAAPRLAQLSSTTFDSQLDVTRRVVHDNPPMYFEIQSLNDYGTESLTALLYAVERIRSVVRAGDEEAFTLLMERGRAYLAGAAEARRPRN